MTDTNVTELRPKADPTNAARQAKYRKKRKALVTVPPDRGSVAETSSAPPAPIAPTSPPLAGRDQAARNGGAGVTVATLAPPPQPRPRRTSRPLVALAYGFGLLGVGINGWNAWTGGALVDMALPAIMGVLAEGTMFFLPSWAMTLPIARSMLALTLLMLLVVPFALTNSLRMASIISTDAAMGRADRQTVGTENAKADLDKAKGARDQAWGKGLGKTVACQSRQSEVTRLEGNQTQATNKVAAQAKPEAADFAKLVTWASMGTLRPQAGDFEMLWLLFRTLLPGVHGGLPSSFDRLPPRLRNPDTDDLDRLAASLHHLKLLGREPRVNEAGDHVGIEPMSDLKQFLGGAVRTAGE